MSFMITRDNYEEFFLLYVDNELSAAQRQLVEDWVAENPDLTEEWQLLLQCRIAPDPLVFMDRESLFRQESDPTHSALLLSYIDGELDEKARKSVEELVLRNPSRRAELASLQRTVSVPDPAIVFENKELLYRKEEERRVVLFPWRMAAAALVAGVVGLLLFNSSHKGPGASVAIAPTAAGPTGRPGVAPSQNADHSVNAPDSGPSSNLTPAGSDQSANKDAQVRASLPVNPKDTAAQKELLAQDNSSDDKIIAPGKKIEQAVTHRSSPALHLSEAGHSNGTTAVTKTAGQSDRTARVTKTARQNGGTAGVTATAGQNGRTAGVTSTAGQNSVTAGVTAAAGQNGGTAGVTAAAGQNSVTAGGQHAPGTGKPEEDHRDNTLAQTDPLTPAKTKGIDQQLARTATPGVDADGPMKTAGMKTIPVVNHPTIQTKDNSFATQALLSSSGGSPDDGLDMEDAPLKKNKLRGLFRKVTRVLEKTTSRDEDDHRSVLVGSFQFALK